MKFSNRLFFTFAIVSLVAACTNNDEQITEPASDEVDTSEYPDDPAMTDDPEVTASDPDFSSDDTEDGIGELTDEPFPEDSEPPPEELPVSPTDTVDDSYAGAFDDAPGYDITEPIESDVGFVDPQVDSGDEQVRYVKAILLNVRSQPNFRAPIVRRLLGGAKITVTFVGKFAKLRNGQYVSSKFLSANPTRKVSRSEAAKAWRKSRYKDTWVPPR